MGSRCVTHEVRGSGKKPAFVRLLLQIYLAASANWWGGWSLSCGCPFNESPTG